MFNFELNKCSIQQFYMESHLNLQVGAWFQKD